MKRNYLLVLCLVLFSLLLSTHALGVDYNSEKFTDAQKIQDDLASGSQAKVIVVLDESALSPMSVDWTIGSSVQNFQNTVASLQDSVLSALSAQEYTGRYQYQNFAAFAGSISESGLDKLIANNSVLYIQPVMPVYKATAQGLPLMNAISSRGTYDGSGVSIAIVDDAVDYTHPDLGGGGFPNAKVIGGYDFGNDDADPAPVLPGSDQAHGTSCAGVAAGSTSVLVGDYIGGAAPGAKIYALKFSNDTDGGFTNDGGIASWDWCITHQYDDPQNPILVLSNSWGAANHTDDEAFADQINPAEAMAAGRCVAAGMVVVVASGNEFSKNGISLPAANSNTLAVGAVRDTTGVVMDYSNSGNLLDLLAPSDFAYTTDIVGAEGYSSDNWMTRFTGTSCATPYAAGMIAALQQASKALQGQFLTPGEVLQYLSQSGNPTTDSANNITKPLIDLESAISQLDLPSIDTDPPSPDPMEWDVEPTAVGLNTIYMESVVATDDTDVQYSFECVNDPNFDSGWQSERTYYRGGYAEGTTYQFRVQARDGEGNETAYSSDPNTTTASGTDTLPPAPNPMTWKGTPRKISSTRIAMEAWGFDEAVNDNGQWKSEDIEYSYECLSNPAFSSGWISNSLYVVNVPNNNEYTFRAKVRDANHNESDWSAQASILIVPPPIVREVPYPYANIQAAVDAASLAGDTVLVHPGVHSGAGNYNIDFSGKKITIRSENPENDSIVASTIIDCGGTLNSSAHTPRRAFLFQNGEDANSVVAGFTIQNAFAVNGPEVANPVSQKGDDPNGIDAYGGAILIGTLEYDGNGRKVTHTETPASPTIRNCVFKNCYAQGQNGNNGISGLGGDADQPGQAGDNGGDGGLGKGGVIYCVDGSAPLIKECQFINCRAVGGVAGNGGSGGDGGPASDATAGQAGGDGGSGGWGGCGWGGAIYFEPNCLPELYDVTVSTCLAKVGEPGSGGDAGNGSDAGSGGGDGGDGGRGGDAGDLLDTVTAAGAVYFGMNTNTTIDGCQFDNCSVNADVSGTYTAGHGGNGGAGNGDGANGGAGGDGGDSYYVGWKIAIGGASNTGGNGGNGGEPGDNGQPGAGGNGGAGYGTGGSGNPSGVSDGSLGLFWPLGQSNMMALSTYAGANYYGDASTVSMTDCFIQNNRSFVDNGGGEYYAPQCLATVNDTEIQNNSTFYQTNTNGSGGGIYIDDPNSFEFTGCAVSGNQTLYGGGGIYFGAKTTGAVLIFTDCIFTDNQADEDYQASYGGAVYAGDLTAADDLLSGTILSPPYDVNFVDCNFNSNVSPYGGGICTDGVNLKIQDTEFYANSAEYGGGVFSNAGNTRIHNTLFDRNVAQATDGANPYCSGAALYNLNSILNVLNVSFVANDAAGFGGSVLVSGPSLDYMPQQFANCLFVQNTAGIEGGAMAATTNSDVAVTNCTFVDNEATDVGGALLCHDAFVDVSNSIFWSTEEFYPGAVYGPQIAVGDPYEIVQPYDPEYIPYSTVFVDYTDVQGGEADISLAPGDGPWVWYNEDTNIEDDPATEDIDEADPLFVSTSIATEAKERTFYLSQVPAGQLEPNSPCLNAGIGAADDLAALLGFGVTTRTDHVTDANDVDMGYHYDAAASQKTYTLTLVVKRGDIDAKYEDVVLEAIIGGQNADPNSFTSPLTETVTAGSIVNLSVVDVNAIIGQGFYTVKRWDGGTEDDGSTAWTNTVKMNANKTITLECETTMPALYVLYDENDGTVKANGEVIPTGSYTFYSTGAVVNLQATPDNASDKVRWLSGTDDNDELGNFNTVRMTESKDVEVEFYTPTIYDVTGDFTELQYAIDRIEDYGNDGDIIILHPGLYDPVQGRHLVFNKDIVIQSYNPDDPETVANTVIRNCGFKITGTSRKLVLNGITIANANYGGASGCDCCGPTGDGGNGGSISGGGIKFLGDASATVKNCRIVGCSVTGGNGGGGGGDGGWGGYAHGGAVSVGVGGDPQFINCQFLNNFARGGSGGDAAACGSAPGRGGSWDDPLNPWDDWDFGPYPEYWKYSGYGGAVYCHEDSAPEFKNCLFSGNTAYGGHTGAGSGMLPGGWYKIDRYGGAIYAAERSTPVFTECVFEDNQADTAGPTETVTHSTPVPTTQEDPYWAYGGTIAFEDDAKVTLIDCAFENSTAHHGGGIYAENATLIITDCNFAFNTAYFGGAIYDVNSIVTVDKTQFIENDADLIPADANLIVSHQGGAVFAFGSDSEFTDVVLNGNSSNRSGGGFFVTDGTTTVKNALIINNDAVRDGAGFSANWYAAVDLHNCTFSMNEVLGTSGGISQGGAIFAGYQSYVDIIDSILWGNSAGQGQQIAISTGFEFDPVPSTVTISHTDVQGNRSASSVFVDTGCTLNWDDPTMIYDDPLFVDSLTDNYHLTQPNIGDPLADLSPCVDVGSDLASVLGLDKYTTTYPVPAFDTGIVDLGYHYPFEETTRQCAYADLSYAAIGYQLDGIVDINDLAVLAGFWLDQCDTDNRWCQGSDLNFDSGVNLLDFAFMAGCWGVFDFQVPSPDPARWAMAPKPTDEAIDSITMEAVQATDNWIGGVEYKFVNLTDPSHDSKWRQSFDPNRTGPDTEYVFDENDPNVRAWIHIDSPLTAETSYTYEVITRDVAGNETAASTPASAIPGIDNSPPEPDPSQWAADGEPRQTLSGTITMQAVQATDNEGNGVEYLFVCVEDGGFSSGWQQNADPCDPGYVDPPATPWNYEVSGLTLDQTYTFYVKTRDRSLAQNETAPSSSVAVTIAEIDDQPPLPDPAEHASGSPFQLFIAAESRYYHVVTAVEATDDSGVEYKFVCSNSSFSSGDDWDPDGIEWRNLDNVAGLFYPNGTAQMPQQYWANRGIQNAGDDWYIIVRDRSPNQNTAVQSESRTIFTPAP